MWASLLLAAGAGGEGADFTSVHGDRSCKRHQARQTDVSTTYGSSCGSEYNNHHEYAHLVWRRSCSSRVSRRRSGTLVAGSGWHRPQICRLSRVAGFAARWPSCCPEDAGGPWRIPSRRSVLHPAKGSTSKFNRGWNSFQRPIIKITSNKSQIMTKVTKVTTRMFSPEPEQHLKSSRPRWRPERWRSSSSQSWWNIRSF